MKKVDTEIKSNDLLLFYIIGFILSILLTLTAYAVVQKHAVGRGEIIVSVSVLAITQFMVQTIFFLHLASEAKPRLKLLAYLFMIGVVSILVFGSLWIMNNLNYNTMSSHDTDMHIIKDEGIAPSHQ